MNWIEASIFTTSEAIEEVSSFLYDLGITGLVIEDNQDLINFLQSDNKTWDYVDDELLKKCDSQSCIKFYVLDDIQGKEKLALVTSAIGELKNLNTEIDFGELNIKIANVSENDWANNWKKYYKPIRIGKTVVIKPSWEDYDRKEGDLVVEIDPGMAFGTGTHETTSMCIELLQKYIKKDDTVLDIGCGSGILSITSAVLGAKRVLGVDFDSVAVTVASDNVKKNNLENIVTVKCGDLMDVVDIKGNIIVANIVADVIIKLSKDVSKFSLSNCLFIASGIIKDRLNDVKTAFAAQNFEIIEIVSKGEWVAVVVNTNA